MNSDKRFSVLGVHISAVDLEKAADKVDALIAERQPGYICVAPVSTVVHCQEDETYRALVNKAYMVTPDGMPLVWLAHFKGYKEVQRTYGPDLMLRVCDRGQEAGYRHFLYGATEDTCQKLQQALKVKFPQIEIVGHYAPPFRELTPEEETDILAKMNQLNPDIIWVATGSPRQDFWVAKYRSLLTAPVLIGIGAAFDFHAGVKSQAPPWMQRSGLEWLFRLCSEPRRLGKRYLIGNSKFIWFLIKDGFKRDHTSPDGCHSERSEEAR